MLPSVQLKKKKRKNLDPVLPAAMYQKSTDTIDTSFNFIRRSGPRTLRARPPNTINRGRHFVQTSPPVHHNQLDDVVLEETKIMDQVIEQWALRLQAKNVPLDVKKERLKDSLLSHSQTIAEQSLYTESVSSSVNSTPNAICTAMCFECFEQLRANLRKPSPILGLVFQGLLNSVYHNYDPHVPFYKNMQYADLCRQMQERSQKELIGESRDDNKSEEGQSTYANASTTEEIYKAFCNLSKEESRQECVQVILEDLTQEERKEALLLLLDDLREYSDTTVRRIFFESNTADIVYDALSNTAVVKPSSDGLIRRRKTLLVNNDGSRRASSVNDTQIIVDQLQEVRSILAPQNEMGEDSRRKNVLERAKKKVTKVINSITLMKSMVQGAEEFVEGREEGTFDAQVLEALVEEFEANPERLGSLLCKAPHLLLRGIEENPGLLKYAIVMNSPLTKEFLHLDTLAGTVFDRITLSHSEPTDFIKNDADLPLISPQEKKNAIKEWIQYHLTDEAETFLENANILHDLFEEMYTRNPRTCRRITGELIHRPPFESARAAISCASFEKALNKDPAIFQDTVRQMESKDPLFKERIMKCPQIMFALNAIDRESMWNMVVTNMYSFKDYIVPTIAESDYLFRESIFTRIQALDGQTQMMQIVDSIITQGVILPEVKEAFSRSKKHKRGESRAFSRTLNLIHMQNLGRDKRESRKKDKDSSDVVEEEKWSRSSSKSLLKAAGQVSVGRKMTKRVSKSKLQSKGSEKKLKSNKSRTVVRAKLFVDKIPMLWKNFLRHQNLNIAEEMPIVKFNRRQLRTTILDIFIERIKHDELQKRDDNCSDMSPYVCDYLMNKFRSRKLVGDYIAALVLAMELYPKDNRVQWFAQTCQMGEPMPYGALNHYLQTLGYLLLKNMQIFLPQNRDKLCELKNGVCAIPLLAVLDALPKIFEGDLDEKELRPLVSSIKRLPVLHLDELRPDFEQLCPHTIAMYEKLVDSKELYLDFDEVMGLIMKQWNTCEAEIDVAYEKAFRANDQGNNLIGMSAFVNVVRTITHDDVSAREARLIFYDIGEDYIDLKTLLHVSNTYDLRMANEGQLNVLDDSDKLDELEKALDTPSCMSLDHEYMLLVASYSEIATQFKKLLEASQIPDGTKKDLRHYRSKMEAHISGQSILDKRTPSSTCKGWTLFRDCINSLDQAQISQRHLSALCVQISLKRWISRARRKRELELQEEIQDNVITGALLEEIRSARIEENA